MDELKNAIEVAGGVTALAKALRISQSRVSNWLTRGSVPDGWREVLRIRYPLAKIQADSAPPKSTQLGAQGGGESAAVHGLQSVPTEPLNTTQQSCGGL